VRDKPTKEAPVKHVLELICKASTETELTIPLTIPPG
jgi:hypothetical protein